MGQALNLPAMGAAGAPMAGACGPVDDERPAILGDMKMVEPRMAAEERLEENEVGDTPTENVENLKKYRESFLEDESVQIDWAYLEELFSGGADVNGKDGDGMSLVHDAARCWDVELMQRLVDEHGADLNMMTNKGVTPLHAAVMGNHIDMVNYFVTDCGQEINQPVGNKSMLHLAAISQAPLVAQANVHLLFNCIILFLNYVTEREN